MKASHQVLPPSITRNRRRRSGAMNLQNYLKLVASGEVDATMLEALEDYVKRQKKRLGVPRHVVTGEKPPATFLGGGKKDEAAN